MKVYKYNFELRNEEDINKIYREFSKLLLKLNEENNIFKYKYTLLIYSNEVSMENIGKIIPSLLDAPLTGASEDKNFFKNYDISSCQITTNFNKRELEWSYYNAIKIYLKEIKFYKRFKNYQLNYILILKELKKYFISLKQKGVIKLEVIVELSKR
jgi:hypothetical protein